MQISQDGPLHYIFRGQRLYFPKNIVFVSLKINIVFERDPDKMLCSPVFHLGLHCLQKYQSRGFPSTNDEICGALFSNHVKKEEHSQFRYIHIQVEKW